MKLTSVGKRYGRGPWLFTEVTLDLEPGRVTAVSGSNGSGKSTLLDLVAGLSRPSTGTISGRPRRIGYVPERFPAQQRMSAMAYLTHMGRIRGLSTAAARSSGHALLERFSFTGGLHTALRTLSKGNAQKVVLAQALLGAPELLILDEPWTGLDEIGHDVLSGVVRQSASEGAIVVLSRHLAVPGPVIESVRYDLDEATVFDPLPSPAPAAVDALVHAPSPPWTRRRRPCAWCCSVATVPARCRSPGRVLVRAAAGDTGPDPTADDGDIVAFTVPADDADRLLLAALQAGWSVYSVRSDDRGGTRGSGDRADSGLPRDRDEPA